jgi:arylsulfatase A-like enzyme
VPKDSINRRGFLRGSVAVAIMTLLGNPFVAAQDQSREQMNVLFISIDDLNDWVGCLGGNPQVKTPNMDRLAARGTLFANAHCPSPICAPSRAALLSGMRPDTTGLYHNKQPIRRVPSLRDTVLLHQHFQNSGYHVMGAGKIMHGYKDDFDPAGWDEYYPSLEVPWFYWSNPADDEIFQLKPKYPYLWDPMMRCGPLDLADEETSDGKLAEWACRQLERDFETPFFLGVGFVRPHVPLFTPRKYFDMYPLDEVRIPPIRLDDLEDVSPFARRLAQEGKGHDHVFETEDTRAMVRAYLATVTFVDHLVGQLLDALEASPYAANTMIVLWGDNGWHLGEKLHWGKKTLWEESTRVPLMIDVPGLTPSGSVCRRPANLLDLYPTFVELCRLGDPPHKLEGLSLLPQLRDPEAPRERPSITTFGSWGRGGHAARSERWRYIRYETGDEELYDHEKDPNEWNNLAGDPQYADLKRELAAWFPEYEAPVGEAE